MPKFAKMLVDGMEKFGHSTEVWKPKAIAYSIPTPKRLKKWLGYIDQFLFFPLEMRLRLIMCKDTTLFVFTDQALGPWIPLLANRPHVIHCHDFLAQKSALGLIAENCVSKTGIKYQEFIRKGYKYGQNFISISNKTRLDLHTLLGYNPARSEMVYNGIVIPLDHKSPSESRRVFTDETGIPGLNGFLIHVGGNQWYKNRVGVIEIYNSWRKSSTKELPLVLIGAAPDAKLLTVFDSSPYKSNIFFLTGRSDDFVTNAYRGASLLLFPSLAEGFGWPIIEAMAQGCPVITTMDAPMTEVGGDAATYIDLRPSDEKNVIKWSINAALAVENILKLSDTEKGMVSSKGYLNVRRFDLNASMTEIHKIYCEVLNQF